MHWLFLLIASLFEAVWIYSVKFFSFDKIKTIRFHNFCETAQLTALLPVAGYILCGLGNVYFFSLSLKNISTATAYAIWTGLTLIMVRSADTLFFNDKISVPEIFFLSLITIGIVGMKLFAGK